MGRSPGHLPAISAPRRPRTLRRSGSDTCPCICFGCSIPYNERIVGAMSVHACLGSPISRRSCLISGPHGEENDPGTSSRSAKSCLAITGCRFLVVHVHVGVGLFELTQWLDAMVRHDEKIRILVDMLEGQFPALYRRQRTGQGSVYYADRVDLRVIALRYKARWDRANGRCDLRRIARAR